ncbi:MAG TPA: hypothetical protein VEA69_12575 [Tepidisphaeraceae bacterium]|nr:hypothetical protein [Tepidisphaeraceae bacterium]
MIRTISVSDLQANLQTTLSECADSGDTLVVEVPDRRLVTIQPLEAGDNDALVDRLIEMNPAFREMIERSKRGGRRPFVPSASPGGE